MRLQEPVRLGARVLVPAQAVLDDALLLRLQQLGVKEVAVVDLRVQDVQESLTLSERTRRLASEAVEGFVSAVRSGRRFIDTRPLHEAVAAIAEDLTASPGRTLRLLPFDTADSADAYLLTDALNVATLCLAARPLVTPEVSPEEAGLAGLLHDVGLFGLPEAARRPATLQGAELEHAYRSHPSRGLEILRAAPFSALVRAAVAQHHERVDGSGFPHGRRGGEIHPLALLVGLADLYVDLLSGAATGEPTVPHEAVEALMSLSGFEFEQKQVERFVHRVTPYPLGCLVRLNTGEVGVVVRVPPGLPTRPTVRVLARDEVSLATPYEVDLADHRYQTVLIRDVLAG